MKQKTLVTALISIASYLIPTLTKMMERRREEKQLRGEIARMKDAKELDFRRRMEKGEKLSAEEIVRRNKQA